MAADGETEDVKPNVAEGDEKFVELRVVDAQHVEVKFRIKTNMQLGKLMKSYGERMGVDGKGLKFQFDGQRIRETDTAKDLGMENDDSIDVFADQIGGGGRI